MSMQTGEAGATSWTHSAWPTRAIAVAWSVAMFAIYLANGREILSGDAIPAKYLALALVHGDGFYLDRYRHELFKDWPLPQLPYFLHVVDGHYVSHYPIGPALVALPFTLPQVLVLDWLRRLGEERAAVVRHDCKKVGCRNLGARGSGNPGSPLEARSGSRSMAGGTRRSAGV